MKKIFVLFLFFPLYMGCSSEDNEVNNSIPDDINNSPSNDTNYFIGEWSCSGGPDWSFSEDGTCYTFNTSNPLNGNWNYDPQKKRLATTCGRWGWDIQLMTENEWSGITLNTGKNYSYKRIISTGSITIQNNYTTSGYGSIKMITIIDSNGNHIKTSTQVVNKGKSQTFTSIPIGIYSIKITINTTTGSKTVTKEGVKVIKGENSIISFS